MNMNNPVEILYAWQGFLLAAVIVGLTQSFKAGIGAVLTYRNKGSGKTGAELRAEITMVDSVLLPLFPLVLGAFIGAVVPLRPDVLTAYTAGHPQGAWTVYAIWGAAVGQFADYIYQRGKRLMTSSLPSSGRGSKEPPVPAVAAGPVTVVPPPSVDSAMDTLVAATTAEPAAPPAAESAAVEPKSS